LKLGSASVRNFKIANGISGSPRPSIRAFS
jgi:hypothetical protein